MKPMQRGDRMAPPMVHGLVENGAYDEVWMNNKYEALVKRDIKPGEAYSGVQEGSEFPPITYITVKRRGNKDCVRDWRHLQEIKNDICGPEAEGVELYPSESRKVDTANQFHLWVFMPPHGFPFGYAERFVCGRDEAIKEGATQRPFRHEDRYCECSDPEVFEQARLKEENNLRDLAENRRADALATEERTTDADNS